MPLNKENINLLIWWNAPNVFKLIKKKKKMVETCKGHHICWTLSSGDWLSLKNILSLVFFCSIQYKRKHSLFPLSIERKILAENQKVLPPRTLITEPSWHSYSRGPDSQLSAVKLKKCIKKTRHEEGTREHVRHFLRCFKYATWGKKSP